MGNYVFCIVHDTSKKGEWKKYYYREALLNYFRNPPHHGLYLPVQKIESLYEHFFSSLDKAFRRASNANRSFYLSMITNKNIFHSLVIHIVLSFVY